MGTTVKVQYISVTMANVANYDQSCNFNLVDIDECETESYDCPSSAYCMNSYGSYHCICTNGTRMDDKGTCTGITRLAIYIM